MAVKISGFTARRLLLIQVQLCNQYLYEHNYIRNLNPHLYYLAKIDTFESHTMELVAYIIPVKCH